MIRKILALAISFSLLGQSVLWAAPAAQEKQPRTLAEYQQQAKNDMQAVQTGLSPKARLSVYFVLGSLVLARTYMLKQEKIQRIEAEMSQKMEQTRAEVSNTITTQKSQIGALEKNIKFWQDKANGLRVSTQRVEENLDRTTRELKNEIANQVKESSQLYESLRNAEALNYVPQEIQHIISKYEALIDPRTSNSKYNLLKRQILEETGLKTASQEERMAFITILDRTREITTVSGKKSATDFMVAALTKHTKNNFPSFYYLKEFLTRLSKSSGVLSVGLLAFLAFSASDAKAAAMTQRVQKNFDLFLNASAEELAEMEKNPQLRETCIQGAQAVHYLSTLPKEELENLRNAFPEAAPARPAINLAR